MEGYRNGGCGPDPQEMLETPGEPTEGEKEQPSPGDDALQDPFDDDRDFAEWFETAE